MALSFLVICEARADFLTSSDLADRVLCESIDWIETDLLEHYRAFDGARSGRAVPDMDGE